MSKEKTTFILYKDTKAFFDNLSNEEAGILIKAIFDYACDKKDIKTGVASVDVVLQFIKNKIDYTEKKYSDKSEKMAEIGRLGGLAKASKSYQMLKTSSNSSLTDTDTDTDTVLSKDNNIKKNITKKETSIDENFMPNETSLNVAKEENFTNETLNRELAKFIDYWKSNGKRKKDWQATFRNWLRKNKEFCGNKSAGKRQEPKSDVEIYAEVAAELENKDGFHGEWS